MQPKGPQTATQSQVPTNDLSTRDQAEPFLTIPEAAKRLGIPDWTLRKAVKRGDIPAFNFATNRWRVRMSEIEQAVRAIRQGAG